MTVTPVGAAIIAFALIAGGSTPARRLQAIFFFASFSATAVINFGNYGMAPAAVLFPAYMLWKAASGELRQSILLARDQLVTSVLVAGYAVICVVSLFVNNAVHHVISFQVTQTAYVLFGLVLTLCLSFDLARPERLEAAIVALRASAVFIALWGILQGVCFYGHLPYPEIFNNSTSHFADMFDQHAGDSVIRISSVATEPSFLATSLMIFGSFGTTLIAIEPRFRTRGWFLSVTLVMLVVTASTSTTGYFGFGVLLLLLGRRRPGLTLGLLAGAIIVGAALLMSLPDFASVVHQVTLGKGATGSYTERTTSVYDALDTLRDFQWWLGTGWGGVTSYSLLTEVVTGTGMIGFLWFAIAVLATIIALRLARQYGQADVWRWNAYSLAIENTLLVYIAMSIVSGFRFVVADFWCLWALAIGLPSTMLAHSTRLLQTETLRSSWRKTPHGAHHDIRRASSLGGVAVDSGYCRVDCYAATHYRRVRSRPGVVAQR